MAQPEKQLLIRFDDFKVKKISMVMPTDMEDDAAEELEISLNYDPFYDPDDRHHFGLNFDVKLHNKDKSFAMDIRAIANFMSSGPIDDEFINSNWVKINAPAIAFPFLRAFVSTVTLNSGHNPIVMPAFNFTKFDKEIPKKIRQKKL